MKAKRERISRERGPLRGQIRTKNKVYVYELSL